MNWTRTDERYPRYGKEVIVRVVWGDASEHYEIDTCTKPDQLTYGSFENGVHVERPWLYQWENNSTRSVTHWSYFKKV